MPHHTQAVFILLMLLRDVIIKDCFDGDISSIFMGKAENTVNNMFYSKHSFGDLGKWP
jgi:hypothetical protein